MKRDERTDKRTHIPENIIPINGTKKQKNTIMIDINQHND